MSQGTSEPGVVLHPTQVSRPNRTGVFLIHGLTGSPTEMSPLDKALQRAGYHTAVPRIAGHGAGHQELLATTWQDWRDGLRRDLHAFAQTCDDVVIVGLCIGGLLGVLLAADEEPVHGLVSLAPDLNFRMPGPGTPWTRFLLPLAYRVPWLMRHGYWTQKPPYGLKNPRLQRRVAKAVAESVRGQTKDFGTFRMYAGTFLQLERLQDTARRTLSRVRCPTLIMHSVEDSMFSIRNATVMYHELGSPQKELLLMTGCDHVMTVDLRKDDVARWVIRFVAGRYGASLAYDQADDARDAAQISPGSKAGTHHLIVQHGETLRLLLRLAEHSNHRAGGAFPVPWSRRVRLQGGDGADSPGWRLARTAIDALEFGVKNRLTVSESGST